MDLEHEGVEMDAPLLRLGRAGEEEIHEHRLAAADGAEDVEPWVAGSVRRPRPRR